MTSLRRYKNVSPQIGQSVYIDSSSVLVGEISIGDDSSVWPLVAARGDVNYIQIGMRTNIQDGSVLHVTHKNPENPAGFPLIIGNDVTIGHKVMLHGCKINDRVLVGMGSIILDGAIIEDEVMIGAGSLVPPNKRLVSGYLYVGSPVKQARPLSDKERAFLQTSADNYVANKNDYLTQVDDLT
jgi:carbonic anhydrase/acetyltransferase-like protein (isoleucine patch superfamily)